MKKIKLRFFTVADWEDEERFLREQHKKGWKFVTFIPVCIFIFESCDPEDVIYRVDYKNNKHTDEYLQLIRDYGWEYVGTKLGWMGFRKPAGSVISEKEGELFSDNESKIKMINNIVKTRLLPLVFIFITCIIPNLINAIRESLGPTSKFFLIIFSLLSAIYIYLILHCSIKLRELKNRYQK